MMPAFKRMFSCRLPPVQIVHAKKRSEDVQEEAVGGLQGWSCTLLPFRIV